MAIIVVFLCEWQWHWLLVCAGAGTWENNVVLAMPEITIFKLSGVACTSAAVSCAELIVVEEASGCVAKL